MCCNDGELTRHSMTKDLALDVGYRYVCMLTTFGLLQANTMTVSRGSYVLRPLYHISASDDRDNEEVGSYLLLGKHHRRMGCDYGRMYQNIVPLIDEEKADTLAREWVSRRIGRTCLSVVYSSVSWKQVSQPRDAIRVSSIISDLLLIGYFPGCVYLLSSWYVRCESIRYQLYRPTG